MAHTEGTESRGSLALLSIAALGVVYGDIGTSPLYALRESFGEAHDIAVVEANVLGVLSLIFWSLILVISIKYLVFVMRADNEGEGGILTLTALVTVERTDVARRRTSRWTLVLIGLFGTALLYGDGIITPAISVLAAVEGAAVATPSLSPGVVPISVVILIGLFAVQNRGTATIGRLFGPVMIVWFAVLAVLGTVHIADAPRVLTALAPSHAVTFFVDNGIEGFLVLGSVFLVVTGGEALYADMGHFGRRPIFLGWFVLVLPALLLNYLGQGAMVLNDPEVVDNPFYRMAPSWGIYPLTILATIAAVIASQALITGVYSLTRQAIQFDYTPRMQIRHTSDQQSGQIYLPAVNWALMAACITLVVTFDSSSKLAAAYGVAVTMTMFITTVLFYVVARDRWSWSRLRAGSLCAGFLVFDLAFLGANLVKVPDGGWMPLVVGGVVFAVMTTWRRGRELVGQRIRQEALPLRRFIDNLGGQHLHRVPGTAVFMASRPDFAPPALLANLRANEVLHEHVVILSILTEDRPRVPAARRATVTDLGDGFHAVVLRFGFMEEPDVPSALGRVVSRQVSFDPLHTTYFLGKESVLATNRPGMALWRERLFALMHRNSTGAGIHFGLPYERTVELGRQVDI